MLPLPTCFAYRNPSLPFRSGTAAQGSQRDLAKLLGQSCFCKLYPLTCYEPTNDAEWDDGEHTVLDEYDEEFSDLHRSTLELSGI